MSPAQGMSCGQHTRFTGDMPCTTRRLDAMAFHVSSAIISQFKQEGVSTRRGRKCTAKSQRQCPLIFVIFVGFFSGIVFFQTHWKFYLIFMVRSCPFSVLRISNQIFFSIFGFQGHLFYQFSLTFSRGHAWFYKWRRRRDGPQTWDLTGWCCKRLGTSESETRKNMRI